MINPDSKLKSTTCTVRKSKLFRNAYWHFIVMQNVSVAIAFIATAVINAYWHFIVMQGQSLEPLTGNASFSILQAPLTIERAVSKNSLKSVQPYLSKPHSADAIISVLEHEYTRHIVQLLCNLSSKCSNTHKLLYLWWQPAEC